MASPRILDLFCGAGGAAWGYHLAGFHVVGVDWKPQKNYPFEFHQMDALEALDRLDLRRFQAIHASPPCQRWSPLTWDWGDHSDLLEPIRVRIEQTELPFVIENVTQAPLIRPVELCGEMFGLGVFRHRGFETNNWGLWQPPHPRHKGKVGDGRYFTVVGTGGGQEIRRGTPKGTLTDWRKAMGISWMRTKAELSQAIPPAYTRHVGTVLVRSL